MTEDLYEIWKRRAESFSEQDKLNGPDADGVHVILVSTEEMKVIAQVLELASRRDKLSKPWYLDSNWFL